MKFLTFLYKDQQETGLLKDGLVYPIQGETGVTGMISLIENYGSSLISQIQRIIGDTSRGINPDDITLLAPIPNPKHDLICLGQNYLEHALEGARFRGIQYKKPNHPVYFSKRVTRAVAPEENIENHSQITRMLDYETELAVVIGKGGRFIPESQVFDHIFGYTIVNDVSARDLQNAHSQFYYGKGLDGFTPMGPYIVTADEFDNPPKLQVSTRVNGELRQNGNTDEFIFDIPYVVSELSKGITLEPGDIIITGTPSGVGMGYDPPRFLQPGDVVECEIEGIGVLRNQVAKG